MPESLLQHILRLAGAIEAPVLLASDLDSFPVAAVERLVAEGVLQETADAEEIQQPARFGTGGSLLVRRAAGKIFGVAVEDDYCTPVLLCREDVRQYAVSAQGLIEKIRSKNEIGANGLRLDNGIFHIGEKVFNHGSMHVSLVLGQPEAELLLGRLKRLESTGRERVLLTPVELPLPTEHERLFRDGGIHVFALYPFAAENSLALDWAVVGRNPVLKPAPARTTVARKRMTGSPEAVAAVEAYMTARALNRAEFSVQAGMTEPTLRRFLESGEVQRSSFKLMAERMGMTPEALLRGELPDSITRSPRR